VAEYELDVFIPAQIGQPVPRKHALGTNNQVAAKAFDGTQEFMWLGAYVPMPPLIPLTIENAQVHPFGMKIDATIVFVLLIVEPHQSPPCKRCYLASEPPKVPSFFVGQAILSGEAMMSIRH
jgi:hypothetical protein